MRKVVILCSMLCIALAFNSCKSNESAYKKAYEKAKAQQEAQETETEEIETPVVTPLVESTESQTTTTDNAVVRSEEVTLINGSGLKNYSVVVGSFSLKTNAEGLQSKLIAAGYDAQIAYNAARNMYRVVASTFDQKADAVYSRDQLRSKYPDAWLLYKE